MSVVPPGRMYVAPGGRVLDAKDPDSTRWYGWDLAGELADGATIAGATVAEVTGGITVGPAIVTGTTVVALVGGGDLSTSPARNNATATLRYATSDGEADVDVTITIPIRPG